MKALDSFLTDCHTRSYKKGEVIIMQNDTLQHAYAIKRGIVKTYNLTPEGEEKSIAFSTRGKIFPMSWLFNKADRALFYKEAYTDCELYFFDKKDFTRLLRTSPRAAYELLTKQIGSSVELALQVNALEQSRAHKKILATFQHLCLRYGKEISPDRVRIKIPFTQAELANFVGLTRETTVTELQKLKDDSVISCKSKLYTVNTALLAKYLDEEYDLGVSIAG